MGTGRDREGDRPVEPDEAREHGNDPDAVRMSGDGPDGGTRADESAPRRVGDVRGEQGGTETDRTDPEGHHLTDPDAATNRATTDADRDTPQGPAPHRVPGPAGADTDAATPGRERGYPRDGARVR